MFQFFTIMHLINGLTYWIESVQYKIPGLCVMGPKNVLNPEIVVKQEAHSERSAAISQSSSVLLAWKRAQAEAARVKLKYTETEVLY